MAADYSDLRALFLNCALKPSPQASHTRNLIDTSASIMEGHAIEVEILRPVDYDLPPGIYGDDSEDGGRVGYDNDFTQRNTTFMTWNLLHLARMLADVGGVPAHGNQRSEWEAGCRFDHPNPEHR